MSNDDFEMDFGEEIEASPVEQQPIKSKTPASSKTPATGSGKTKNVYF